MKKILLFLALGCFISISTSAQTEEVTTETKTLEVTKLGVQTDDWNEVKNFDWDGVRELAAMSKPDADITLSIEYKNEITNEQNLTITKRFEKITEGKISDIDNLIKEMQLAINQANDSIMATIDK